MSGFGDFDGGYGGMVKKYCFLLVSYHHCCCNFSQLLLQHQDAPDSDDDDDLPGLEEGNTEKVPVQNIF